MVLTDAQLTHWLVSAVGALIGMLALLIGYISKAALGRLANIIDGQAAQNTRTAKLEVWTEAHDKQDDERHQDVMDRISLYEQRKHSR